MTYYAYTPMFNNTRVNEWIRKNETTRPKYCSRCGEEIAAYPHGGSFNQQTGALDASPVWAFKCENCGCERAGR